MSTSSSTEPVNMLCGREELREQKDGLKIGNSSWTNVITRVPKCGRGRRVSIRVLPKECVGSVCSPSKKPINRLGWWKRKFALLQMLATEGDGRRTSLQRPAHSTGNQWGKSFYRLKKGATCRNSSQL